MTALRSLRAPLLLSAVVAAVLLGLELAARGLLVLMPSIGDPWAGGIGARSQGELVRQMEGDLEVVSERQRLYQHDRRLFWRLAPYVDMTVENGTFELRDAPPLRWTIRTNRDGFRGAAMPGDREGTRVVALGDSCTFGFRVEEEDSYAARLARACGAPSSPLHVLNAGVPGYTSHQGKVLLAELLDAYHPDVVTIAFGANDREKDVLSDAERAAFFDRPLGRVFSAVGDLGLYRLLAGLLPQPAPAPAASALQLRVDAAAYRQNVEEMIVLAQRASARVVLVDLVFFGPVYRDTLRALATRWNVPLVDGRALLDDAFERISRGEAYRGEAERWREFCENHVASVRPVYFDADFYRRRYATEQQQRQFMMLMADPIHPNAIGHHVIADALMPLVCPPPSGG